MNRRKATSVGCGGKGCKPRKDWSDVVGRCGEGERKRIEAGHARTLAARPPVRILNDVLLYAISLDIE